MMNHCITLALAIALSIAYVTNVSGQCPNDTPDFPNTSSANNCSVGEGSNNFSGELNTPADGQDAWEVTVPFGHEIHEVQWACTADPNGVNQGFFEVNGISSNFNGVQSGTLPITTPFGAGTYASRVIGSVASGLTWTMNIMIREKVTNWTAGAGTADWHTASNWDNGVPDFQTLAVIDLNLTLVEINSSASAAAIRVDNGTLSINANLTINPNDSDLNEQDGLKINTTNALVTVTSEGHLTVRNTADDAIAIAAGQMTNDGTITIEDCVYGIYDAGTNTSTFINRGKIYANNNVVWMIGFSTGSITNEFCGFISTDDNISAANLINFGTILSTSNQNSTINANNNTGIIHQLGSGTYSMTTNNGRVDTNPAANFWRGCSGQAWTDACNWSQDRSPMQADSVVILEGNGDYPELSTMSDTVMHVFISDSLVIKNGGRLIVDGTPATTQRLGVGNRKYLFIEEGGSIHTMHTNSDGINSGTSGSEFINEGSILVEDARFASIQIGSTSFINRGDVTVETANTSGLSIGGAVVTNEGSINVLEASSGIFMRFNDSELINRGEINITNCSFVGVQMDNPASGTGSTLTNEACAIITTDEIFNILTDGTIINSGLINYTAGAPGLAGTYTDDGYQYDPNGHLPDDMTTVLTSPKSLGEFNADLDGDGTTFCEGDNDDVPQVVTCGTTLIGESLGTVDDMSNYSCQFSTFNGGEKIYELSIGQLMIIDIDVANEELTTDIFILEDYADPSSCIDYLNSEGFLILESGTYYIVIDNLSQIPSPNTFDLVISCAIPNDNTTCAQATPLSCGGDTQTGYINTMITDPANDDCGLTSNPGLWYSFIGSGNMTRLSTCGTTPAFDSFISVMSGACGSLVCVDDEDFGCPGGLTDLTIATTQGVTYFVHVSDFFARGAYVELLYDPNVLATGLEVSNITSTTARLSIDTHAEEKDFIVMPAGVPPVFGGTGQVFFGSNSDGEIEATGLTSFTNYDFYVGQGSCEEFAGPVTFRADCPTTNYVTEDQTLDVTYKAISEIISDATIKDPNEVIFKALDIKLDIGFNTEPGALFSALPENECIP